MAKLLCLGDSIMWGVTGFDAAHPRADPTIPDKIGELIGAQVDNRAVSATSVNDGDKSMVSLLSTVNLADYDYIILGYGANDWGLNRESFEALKSGLGMFSSMFSVSGSKAYVLVDLMIESFINNATSLDSPNQLGITQNQVMDVFKSWATENGYHYYDWREDPIVTPQNYKTVLGDGCLHPNFDTQMQMAQRLADYIKATVKDVPTEPSKPDDKPTNPTNPINPDKPNQPDKPVIKLIDQIKIDRLNDLFGIGTNVNNGTNNVIGKINELYSSLETIMGTDSQKAQISLVMPGNALTRSLRNYVLTAFQQLESIGNDVIKICNANWIVDPQTGDSTPTLNLQRVDQLTTNDVYKKTVNNNWGQIETTLNKLIQYLNQVLKGE
ncbi:SGNH/GDSL hydrolase family protein [Limosilactobacillus sp. pH52_RY]|uniref:SGNH/GDSL hydrolase family protein n=1 Tax=Limosilactobacillus balticus TaxID=2759747 RepID=UPI0015FB476B|nr:SGNH/GDSL hydrolase family protein [Limosilactobacillus balticus]MBB1109520.1 SGNH/GDSL hydrolase family protein [Limosilactobacillus balticus]